MNCEITDGNYHMSGVGYNGNITTFTIENKEQKDCAILLHSMEGGGPQRIPLVQKETGSCLYSVGVKNLPLDKYTYTFEIGKVPRLDPYAKRIHGREQWGKRDGKQAKITCGFQKKSSFPWRSDRLPHIPKEDMVMYKLHVRGFSMLQKLKEEEKGTFRGIERRLSYLKELGITTLELMPVYEFEELFAQDVFQRETFPGDKVNYWGYTRGNYFALKSSYLGRGQGPEAFKRLVQKLHKRNMECILEFYFDDELSPWYIADVLRYWAEEYHVDGFHLLVRKDVAALVSQNPWLSGRKLFFDWFSEEDCRKDRRALELFSCNDAFLYSVRKVMNHPEGDIREFADHMRRQQSQQGFVNYVASNNGFTLYDTFTYTQRRNQANGEDNRDGLACNYSSNCGEEGPTRNKRRNRLRERQIKNALCALMFAQGVPLIWMGDESGNSQEGNNNAYCQDNGVGWKSWENTKAGRELVAFFKALAQLRRKYPVLRSPKPMQLSDYRGCGCPDLSYHGVSGWQLNGCGDRTIGMMYACGYGAGKENPGEDYLYIGYNFSETDKTLALPDLPRGYRWYTVLNTGAEDVFEECLMEGRTFVARDRSVCMLVGRQGEASCR